MLPNDVYEKSAEPGILLGPKCSDEDWNNGVIGVNEAVVRIFLFRASKLIYAVAGVFVPVSHHSFCLIKGIISHLNGIIVTRIVIPIKNKMTLKGKGDILLFRQWSLPDRDTRPERACPCNASRCCRRDRGGV